MLLPPHQYNVLIIPVHFSYDYPGSKLHYLFNWEFSSYSMLSSLSCILSPILTLQIDWYSSCTLLFENHRMVQHCLKNKVLTSQSSIEALPTQSTFSNIAILLYFSFIIIIDGSFFSESKFLKGLMYMIPSVSATAYKHICHITDVQEGFTEWLNTKFFLQRWSDSWLQQLLAGLLLFMTVSNNINIKLWFKVLLPNHDSCMPGWSVCCYIPEVYDDVTHFEVDFIAPLICIICFPVLPCLLVQNNCDANNN